MLVYEWVVDKILKHRVTPEGKIEFYVKWLGYDEESAGWETVENFFIKLNTDIIRYCKYKGVKMDIVKQLTSMIEKEDKEENRYPPHCRTMDYYEANPTYDPIWQDTGKYRFRRHGEKINVYFTKIACSTKSWEWCPKCQNTKVICREHQQSMTITEWTQWINRPNSTRLPRELEESGTLTQ